MQGGKGEGERGCGKENVMRGRKDKKRRMKRMEEGWERIWWRKISVNNRDETNGTERIRKRRRGGWETMNNKKQSSNLYRMKITQSKTK